MPERRESRDEPDQGITVEIGGDTTKLQAALRNVDRELKFTQAQLRDVNKMLKLDPGTRI